MYKKNYAKELRKFWHFYIIKVLFLFNMDGEEQPFTNTNFKVYFTLF